MKAVRRLLPELNDGGYDPVPAPPVGSGEVGAVGEAPGQVVDPGLDLGPAPITRLWTDAAALRRASGRRLCQ